MSGYSRQFCIECGHLNEMHDKTGKCNWKDCKCIEYLTSLTSRELEILKALATGSTCKDIARELKLSVSTIEAHKFNFMKKLKLHNKVQVIMFGLKTGLIKFDDLPEFRAVKLESKQLKLGI